MATAKRRIVDAAGASGHWLRNVFQTLGKDKLHVPLVPWCIRRGLNCPSVDTTGRLIADTSDKMRLVPMRLTPKGKGKVKPRGQAPAPIPSQTTLGKGFCADYPGHCVAFDTVVRFIGRTCRYLLTATDHASRFVWALCLGDRGTPP